MYLATRDAQVRGRLFGMRGQVKPNALLVMMGWPGGVWAE